MRCRTIRKLCARTSEARHETPPPHPSPAPRERGSCTGTHSPAERGKDGEGAPMSATTSLLDVTAIETFYGPIQAIRGVSLTVGQGQIVTVLGANGAGKTTVLRTISGVLDPERGSVRFEGRDIAHLPPDRVVRLGICHVPEGRETFPFLTVHE